MHGPQTLLLELFVIFLAAKVVGELFERLRLPAVLGEILAGVVIGPYALGWIHPSDTIESIAEMGAIFVLFNAGLETSPADLIRVGRTALQVALAGILFPFVLGFGYMKLIGDPTTEAIFVGAAMVATSVGITARVLGDLNVLSSELAKVILGAAVFDDILGMVMLAVVAGLASAGGVDWLRMGILLGEAVTFALFMIFVAPRIVRRMHAGVERLSTRNAPLIFALIICLLLSWLSVKIGMAAIIGAFFAGLMFADFAPRWNLLPKAHAINEFLAPFFFFSIGTRLDVGLFKGPVLLTAVVISVLAIFSKVVGCGLPMSKRGWHSFLAVGVGMMPRGEVALIVALAGLSAQIVTQTTYAIVVFMTAVTTVLAPLALRYLFRPERASAALTAASE
ncbi:MAG: cation:proton antiporter [Acidobacteriales bacterium]|nr:cation:proton antiporter [Candidatus Koribacter versatilis]MBI3646517.1 cation:proton antiporter [Terriglobales bacterium]